MTGHIDGTTATTNVDTYTINLDGLTMITGVVLMAAPVTAPDLSSITFSDWNFVQNDEGVVVGPTPDYASCQVQCDVCNAEEDDGNPATEMCTCLSWTWDKQLKSCGLSKFAHTTAESSLAENTFTSGLPSGNLIGGRYTPVGAKIESFSVEYTDRNGNTATVKSFTSVSKQGVETYGATKSFVGNKWRGEEKVYRYFPVAIWASEIRIVITAPIRSQRGFRIAAIQAPQLQLRCPSISNCAKLDAEFAEQIRLLLSTLIHAGHVHRIEYNNG
jgi:hypothetical protein